MALTKIYIDRQSITENQPAIVVEQDGQEPKFCSEVRGPCFIIKQDFSRKRKPVVWIESYTSDLQCIETSPLDPNIDQTRVHGVTA